MTNKRTLALLSFFALACSVKATPQNVKMPTIESPWWQVAGNPTDHKYATEKQEPVGFALWQAADGTWQLWSCIRIARLKWVSD